MLQPAALSSGRSRRGGRGRGGAAKKEKQLEKHLASICDGGPAKKEKLGGEGIVVAVAKKENTKENVAARGCLGWQLRAAQQVLELNA